MISRFLPLLLTLAAIPASPYSAFQQPADDWVVNYLFESVSQHTEAFYENTYGNSSGNQCTICHVSDTGSQITSPSAFPFGWDFKLVAETYGSWPNLSYAEFKAAMTAIENEDSDGDGVDNRGEFARLSRPQVADNTPSPTSTPTGTATPDSGDNSDDDNTNGDNDTDSEADEDDVPPTGDERILKGSGGCGLSIQRSAGWPSFVIFLLPLVLLLGHRRLWIWLLAFGLLQTPESSHAGQLVVTGAEVNVYSGPSRNFRIIRKAKRGESLVASENVFQGQGEEFYRVQMFGAGGQKRLGFLPVNDNVRMEYGANAYTAKDTDQDGQFNSTVRASMISIDDNNYAWSTSYNSYSSSGFVYRGLFGQWLNQLESLGYVGGGVGYERDLTNLLSFSAAGNLSYVIGAGNDNIYPGMSESSSHFLAEVGGDIRYSTNPYASLGVGFSYLTFIGSTGFAATGLKFIMEVGLP